MSVDSVGGRKISLIRKALDAVVFVAAENATAITTLTTGSSQELTTLPAGYTSLGHHTEDDGLAWSRAIDTAEVRSHGSQEPTRRDIVSDVSGLKVIAQETKLKTLELYNNIDLSAVTPTATTGEISYTRATTAQTRYYRLMTIAEDGSGANKLYFGRFLPRVSVTEVADQAWVKGSEIKYELTFTAYVDPTLGFSLKEFIGGPGIENFLVDMGFPAMT